MAADSRVVKVLLVLTLALVAVAGALATQLRDEGSDETTVQVIDDITLSPGGEVLDETGPLTVSNDTYSVLTFAELPDGDDVQQVLLSLRSYDDNEGSTVASIDDTAHPATYVLSSHAVAIPSAESGDWVHVDITKLVKGKGRTQLILDARGRASYHESESGNGPRLRIVKTNDKVVKNNRKAGKTRQVAAPTPTEAPAVTPTPTIDPAPETKTPQDRSTTSTTAAIPSSSSSTTETTAPARPSIVLTSPADGTRFASKGVVRIEATVSNAANSQVDFYAGDLYLGAEESAPYTFNWSVTDADNGSHDIRAVLRVGSDMFASTDRTVVIDIDAPSAPANPTGSAIVALAETDPVPNSGDAADDPAIWVDKGNPARSTVIGTDKLGGLAVYDLSGNELHYYKVGRINNVDIRHGVAFNGRQIDLVAGSERDSDEIRFFEVNRSTRGLNPIGKVSSNLGVAGLCLFHDPATGEVSAFVGDSSGSLEQWELKTSGSSVTGSKARTIRLGSTTEGCVVDDTHAKLYISEEDKGIWRYGARSSDSVSPTMIDRTTSNGGAYLRADIEGLALWNGASGTGYLVASSQSNNTFVVYDRKAPNAYVTTFEVEAGAHDAVDYTDGIAITSADLGGDLRHGLFVAQDNTNPSHNQNFKLVSWGDIHAASIGGSTGANEPLNEPPPTPEPPAENPSPPSPPTEEPADPPTSTGTGTQYHVDRQRGDDSNSGSVSAPFKSLSHAVEQLSAGDSLFLRRGQTWTEKLEIATSGTAAKPIVVDAYGAGDRPIVTGSSSCIRLSGDYLTVRNLTASDCTWAGIRITGKNALVESMLLTRKVAGVYVKSEAVNARILRNDIIDNNVMSVNDEGGSGDSGAFGVLIHGRGTEVGHNTISGSDAFSYDYGRDGAAVEIFGAVDTHVHHNLAVGNDAFVELGESESSGNRFDHNVVISTLDESVFLVTRGGNSGRGPVTGTIAEHNSVHLSGANSQGFVCHGGCANSILTLRNNIIEAQLKVGFADGPFVGGNNVFFGGETQFDLDATDIVADPQWVDPNGGSLALHASSPARSVCPSLGYPTDFSGAPRPAGPVDCGALQH